MTRRKDSGQSGNGGELASRRPDEADADLVAAAELGHVVRTLSDLLEFAGTADRLVRRGRAAFDEDEMLQLAAEAIVHKIGEAVGRLPDAFVKAHPTVSWRPMKGMRNKIAHEYRAIDYDFVWVALAERLPDDAVAVRTILDGLE